MDPFGALGRAWFAARKLRLPIERDALVLEVGSGDSPCPRSDILLDMTLENHERVGGRTVVDRPTVLGLVERLPFRDNAFDYVIAFHVLEHSADPERFLGEIERVGRAGYVETPAAWVERVNPLTMHRLEVGVECADGHEQLVIRRKASPVPDPDLAQLFAESSRTRRWFARIDRRAVVTRYHWRDRIHMRQVNPDVPIDWQPPAEVTRSDATNPRPLLRRFLAWAAQRTHRPRAVPLVALLQCPDCEQTPLDGSIERADLRCPRCDRRFTVTDGIPHLHPAGWSLR